MKYKYEVFRSARQSVSVSVSDDNKITVRCPWGMSSAEIEKFLGSKQKWIEKVVLENSYRLALNDDVIEYRAVYVNGKKVPLITGNENKILPDGVYVKNVELIEKLYISEYSGAFIERVRDFALKMRLYPNEISVKGYRGRWGCCDTKNNLSFNFVLFMLPQDMRDYVIVHELCHTLCHNHSNAFWKLVETYCPDYKKLRAGMKNFSFLNMLY